MLLCICHSAALLMSTTSYSKAVSFQLPTSNQLLSAATAISVAEKREPVHSTSLARSSEHPSPLTSHKKATKPSQHGTSDKIFVKSADGAPTSVSPSKPVATAARVVTLARELRHGTNSTSHDHVRRVKYQVAKLREQTLKVEEDVRQSSKTKHVLELAILDMRKALSINQQSLSTQQKKMRGEVGLMISMYVDFKSVDLSIDLCAV